MVTRLFIIAFLLIGSMGKIHAEELIASVDRTQVNEHDSITLTVKYGSNQLSGSPDFAPLRQHFNVLNNHRKNSFQMINGQTSSWTIWTLTLQPKRRGNLVIPSLEYKGKQTKPIQIRVNKASNTLQKQNRDVFFHVEANRKTAYVQSQVLYTEKLYFAVNLDNGEINDFQVADAVTQQLGESRQYRTQLNGRSYTVFERNFAVFPQTSGELIIPGPRYSGEISRGPWKPGRPISATHPPLNIEILPQPTQYPQAPWLPTENLDIQFRWSGQPNKMKVGEPITLELTVEATGLSGAQLPPIPLADQPDLKYYPDQAKTEDQTSDAGVLGSRTQKIAVVATQEGAFTFPEVKIPWWNTKTNQVEFASIPKQTLTVAGSALSPHVPVPQASTESTSALPISNSSTQTISASWWPWLTLIVTILWLGTSYLYFQKPRTKIIHTNKPEELNEINAAKLKDIKSACRAGNASAARAALLSWFNNQRERPVNGLAEIALYAQDNRPLSQALSELDHTLYASTINSAWQGEHLWSLIKNWDPTPQAQKPLMDGLYPNTELTAR